LHNIQITDGMTIALIPQERYNDVINHMKNNYVSDEVMCKSIGVEWSDEWVEHYHTRLSAGLSLMAVHEGTGDIMGVMLSVVKTSVILSPESGSEDALEKCLRAQYREIGDLFKRFDVTEIFHFIYLSVDQRYRRQGLGRLLLSAGAVLAKELGQTVMHGDASSMFSQRICDGLGFDMIHRMNYADYMVDGKVVFNNTGDHTCVQCYSKTI
jgi:GNAT superfamily N-acetyltransferase